VAAREQTLHPRAGQRTQQVTARHPTDTNSSLLRVLASAPSKLPRGIIPTAHEYAVGT
jgi:hypothetical protein